MADDLDDILNSALDELDLDDDEEEEAAAQTQAKATASTAATAPAAGGKGSSSGAAAAAAAATSSSAARGGARVTGAGASAASSEAGEEGEGEDEEERELQAAIAKTLGLLGKLDASEGAGAAGAEGEAGVDGMFDEAFLNKLVEEFDRLGGGGGDGDGGGGGEGMVDGMVKQLLAKDLMYPPLREVTRQFPEWLAAHRGKTEAGVFKRYEEQHALFQRIVAVYEAPGEPDMGQLLDLMTQAQEYGQPPPEIVQALGVGPGSGLDGGDAGMGMGGLLPPGLGLPVGPDGQVDPEACVVM